jgi:hypothetical protein
MLAPGAVGVYVSPMKRAPNVARSQGCPCQRVGLRVRLPASAVRRSRSSAALRRTSIMLPIPALQSIPNRTKGILLLS